jgi:hypothetical protein
VSERHPSWQLHARLIDLGVKDPVLRRAFVCEEVVGIAPRDSLTLLTDEQRKLALKAFRVSDAELGARFDAWKTVWDSILADRADRQFADMRADQPTLMEMPTVSTPHLGTQLKPADVENADWDGLEVIDLRAAR